MNKKENKKENYGCGYCAHRDSIMNWCMKHNKPVEFKAETIDNPPTCEDYFHDDSLPMFFCAWDNGNLYEKDAKLCSNYVAEYDEDDVDCGSCKFFRDNMTPDTIISLGEVTKSFGTYYSAGEIDIN